MIEKFKLGNQQKNNFFSIAHNRNYLKTLTQTFNKYTRPGSGSIFSGRIQDPDPHHNRRLPI